MNVYFDTEFTGLHVGTTLVSIGLITASGKTFYSQLTDYDGSQVDKWIQDNVINNLISDKDKLLSIADCTSTGNKEHVGRELRQWLSQFDTVEWYSDVCQYDFVLLVDLLVGNALKLPYGKWNSACHDINQDIAEFLSINEIEAFDRSREDILKEYGVEVIGEKHNSLHDARVIRELYRLMKP